MNEGDALNGNGRQAGAHISFEDMPVAPERDIISMTRAFTRVREVLGVSREDATAALQNRLVGGILPDVSLSQLESLAAAGRARVKVVIETEDGRSFNLALI